MTFDATRTYQPKLDVRSWDRWRDRLRGEPEGVLWALIGSRRSGKTWALRALESNDAIYLNLQMDSESLSRSHNRGCLLVDEPGRALQRARLEFVERCRELKLSGIRVLIAMTPGEWQNLVELDPEQRYVKARDCLTLPTLTDEQAVKLARTKWAAQLLNKLPQEWKRNPFLLELIFETAENSPAQRRVITKLDYNKRLRPREIPICTLGV
jgi:hypothetical protein